VSDPPTWYAELSRRRAAGELVADDLVPGAGTVLIEGTPDPSRLASVLPSWRPSPLPVADSGLVEIDVVFDGPDLAFVASHWDCSVEAAVLRLRDTELSVAFCGFSPGFAYLTGLPGEVPRLETPRARVPAGSVALGGPYAGVYPTASPGGWRLVGRTEAVLFEVDRDPPALLTPGTRVRFR